MPKVTFIVDGETQIARGRSGDAAVLAPRAAGIAARHRQEPRHPARARVRRQLRVHDLPRDRPRGRAEPERHGGRRGGPPRHRVGRDAAFAPRVPGGRAGRRRRARSRCTRATTSRKAAPSSSARARRSQRPRPAEEVRSMKWTDSEDIGIALVREVPGRRSADASGSRTCASACSSSTASPTTRTRRTSRSSRPSRWRGTRSGSRGWGLGALDADCDDAGGLDVRLRGPMDGPADSASMRQNPYAARAGDVLACLVGLQPAAGAGATGSTRRRRAAQAQPAPAHAVPSVESLGMSFDRIKRELRDPAAVDGGVAAQAGLLRRGAGADARASSSSRPANWPPAPSLAARRRTGTWCDHVTPEAVQVADRPRQRACDHGHPEAPQVGSRARPGKSASQETPGGDRRGARTPAQPEGIATVVTPDLGTSRRASAPQALTLSR